MRSFILIALLFCSHALFGQTGNYFLSHFAPEDDRFDNVTFDMAQDGHGIIYYATKTGIWQFDGSHWNTIGGDGAIYTLQSEPTGQLFWGGANGFGKISEDQNGVKRIIHLSDKSVTDIFESITTKENVYFLNNKSIFIHSKLSGRVTQLSSTNITGSFSGIFELFDKVYVNTEREGIFVVAENNLAKANFDNLENSEFVFANRFGNAYLIGMADNRVFLCSDKLKFTEIKLESEDYLRASVVINGSWLNDNLAALGTLRGGVIFINPKTGRTEQIINYKTGLPDNEVFCMMSDQNQNLWIAHDYGYTRIAPYIPLHSFSHYDGLQGNLLCARTFHHQVYVGTSLGLFTLQKEDLYDEIVYYVTVPVVEKVVKKKTTKKAIEPEVKVETPVKVENESKKKGFFHFLRRKETEPVPTTTKEVVADKQNPTTEKKTLKQKFKQEKRTQRILRSSQFVYKRVGGIDAKVTQLIEVNGKLLSIGLAGVHEVTGTQSRLVLEEPARFAFANKNILLVSTYEDEIRSWAINADAWQRVSLFENLDDRINYIFDGSESELWLCAGDKAYHIKVVADHVESIKTISLPGKNVNESVGLTSGDRTWIINSNGFFAFGNDKFVKEDTLNAPKNYFAGNREVWYRDQHRWNSIGTKVVPKNLQLLNIFNDLRFVTADEDPGNLWLITATNELYKFNDDKHHERKTNYPLFVKSIRSGNRNFSDKLKLQLDERESSLTVEVVKPDFVGGQSMEYRYWLKGLHKEWSEWSGNNNVVDFAYLPTGNYTLLVQAKDVFGTVNEMRPLSVQVRPPYWQRTWFYALEFAIFAVLVLLSFRLSSRYIIVSRILSLLTIILLIQFIQTAASATFSTKSPVIDFIIQVIVALLILPVEGYLRKLMLKSNDHSTGIRQLIKEKKQAKKK